MRISATTSGEVTAPGLKSARRCARSPPTRPAGLRTGRTRTRSRKKRAVLLTFVVIGGGPTGVELAGALAEISRQSLARDFRHFDPSSARIVLVEAGPAILTTFPEMLREAARKDLETTWRRGSPGQARDSCRQRARRDGRRERSRPRQCYGPRAWRRRRRLDTRCSDRSRRPRDRAT